MEKYLVYKISGGLCHMLLQINRAIHLSILSKRFLIIDCRGNAFDNDFNKYFNIPGLDYATNYEKIDNTIVKASPLFNATAVCKGSDYFLTDKLINVKAADVMTSDENIIFCCDIYGLETWGKIPWYIKVHKYIVDSISLRKINEDYIGVHYRNTDMKHDIHDILRPMYEVINKCNTIYLATDDYTAYSRLHTLLLGEDDFRIIQYTIPYNNNGYSIHYGNPNKDEVIMNALIDMYHLVHATYFVPSIKSGFSLKVIELRQNDNLFK